MASSPTQRVRTACKAVADGANFVRIERDLAPSYAVSLPLEQAIAPQLDPNRHYFGNPYDTVAFFLTLDSINFGSGYFTAPAQTPRHVRALHRGRLPDQLLQRAWPALIAGTHTAHRGGLHEDVWPGARRGTRSRASSWGISPGR